MSQKIGFIGLGKMGTAIAEQLIKSGYSLIVYNRTTEKMAALVNLGAETAESAEILASKVDIVFTSLIDDAALIAMTEKILPHLRAKTIHVSTSTILPKTATYLEQLHQAINCSYIAAPLLGVPKAVRAKKAMTICAGQQKNIKQITSLFETYSSTIENLGSVVAHANVFKICINYSLVSALELISELYSFAEKSGLETNIVQEFLTTIYAHPGIQLYINKIHERNFDEVNFDMKGGNKDINLFEQAFLEVGVNPDIATMVRSKFTQALANGMAEKDWSAISEIIRQRSGLK